MAAPGTDASVYGDLMRFKPVGMSPNGWAMLAGVSRTVWADMKRHDNPSRRTLEKLLTVAGSSLAEFEALRIGARPAEPQPRDWSGSVGDHRASSWPGASLPTIPVFLSALAKAPSRDGPIDCATIDRSQSIASVARPASLAMDRGAFALTMLDNTMWPRFRSGRRLIVSPLAPVLTGDDVLVTIGQVENGDGLVVIGELIRRIGRMIELRQFNPARTIRVELASSSAIAKIVGEAY